MYKKRVQSVKVVKPSTNATKRTYKIAEKAAERVLARKVERKYFEQYINLGTLSGTSNTTEGVYAYNIPAIIPKGVQAWARIGEQITLKGIHFKGMVKYPAASSGAPWVNVAVVRTTQPKSRLNSAGLITPAGYWTRTDLLRIPTSGTGVPALYTIDSTQHKVVCFKRIQVTDSGANDYIRTFAVDCRLNAKVRYLPNSDALQGKATYSFLVWADEPGNTGGSTGVLFEGVLRATFEDE